MVLAGLGSLLAMMWVLARGWRFQKIFWPKVLVALALFNYLSCSAETGLYRKCVIQIDGEGGPGDGLMAMLTLPVFFVALLTALTFLFYVRWRTKMRKPV